MTLRVLRKIHNLVLISMDQDFSRMFQGIPSVDKKKHFTRHTLEQTNDTLQNITPQTSPNINIVVEQHSSYLIRENAVDNI